MAKALGYFIAANGQAIAILWFAHDGIKVLEKEYPIPYSWSFIIWPVAIAAVIQMYVMIMKALLRLEKNRKK